ncbi:MAG: class I SAM-dependent methyltransferase [Lachnospiraceae bacterium]
MIQLSKRLQALANLVDNCETVADVGTDHGYIPVYLVDCKKAKRAIAMDVNLGPLLRAKEHIEQYNMQKKIESRLSDGLSALKPKEAEIIVIAGMGGGLMMRILTQGKEIAKTARRLVLQPQSELMAFREFLYKNNYQIVAEDMVFEEGKYYPMLVVQNAKWELEKANRIVFQYGPLLLQQKHPVLQQYLLLQQEQKRKILLHLSEKSTENATNGKAKLEQELEDIENVLQLMQSLDNQIPHSK